jgi:HSP20 family protein
MNSLFDDFFYPAAGHTEKRNPLGWHPAVDIFDNDANIVIKAELPGIDKKDIAIDVKDRVLTLKGERVSDNDVKEDHFYRRERTYGKFERSFTLPAHVKTDDIKADYKDGVLRIDIPKPEAQQPKQITVH